jgi:hypothetical protein
MRIGILANYSYSILRKLPQVADASMRQRQHGGQSQHTYSAHPFIYITEAKYYVLAITLSITNAVHISYIVNIHEELS